MAKDFFETIVARAGFAGEFEALTETEIAGPVSGPYVPGEDGVWKIVASRVVQLLLGSPLHIRTFQTSDATLRMPSGDLPISSSDAQDGRFYFIRNDITASGKIQVQKYDGTFLGTLTPGDFAVVVHGDFDDWDLSLITMTASAPQTIIVEGEPGEDGWPGPPGAPGTTGSQGPTGPAVFLDAEQGEDGPPGPPGTKGDTGSTGSQGPAGPAVFLEAEPGEEGPPGPPGQKGDTGPQGLRGPAIDGEQGEDGPPGPPGRAGDPGATGSQGPAGPAIFLDAEQGEEGPPGVPGRAGDPGATGSQGPAGPAVFLPGEPGEEGPMGVPGSAGPAGAVGPMGPMGPAIFLEAEPGEEGVMGPPGVTKLIAHDYVFGRTALVPAGGSLQLYTPDNSVQGVRMITACTITGASVQVKTADASNDYKLSIRQNGTEVALLNLSNALGSQTSTLSVALAVGDVLTAWMVRTTGSGGSAFNDISAVIETST